MTERLHLPDPLGEAAFHGPLGEFVEDLAPITESHPAAILVDLLAGFGNIVGRSPHYRIGGAGGNVQHVNLFVLIVGRTGSGKKGTAWNEAAALLRRLDPTWRVRTGISSGEGLVYHVRDPEFERRPAEEEEFHKADDDGMISEMIDSGVADKRLLARETEFGAVLTVARRTGNTVSERIRGLWDSGDAETLTRSGSLRATNAHVSLVGDVTVAELRKRLGGVEVSNGFVNRFLPILVERTGVMAYPEEMPEAVIEAHAERLRKTLEVAQEVGQMTDSPETRTIYADAYRRFAEVEATLPESLAEAVTRAANHVRRVSMIYALADGSEVIEADHMLAALEVWRYAFQSAEIVFGIPPSLDERVRRLVDRAGPEGVFRSDLRDRLGGRLRAEEIDEAVARLEASGVLISEKLPTGERGRPPTRLVAADKWIEVPA